MNLFLFFQTWHSTPRQTELVRLRDHVGGGEQRELRHQHRLQDPLGGQQ